MAVRPDVVGGGHRVNKRRVPKDVKKAWRQGIRKNRAPRPDVAGGGHKVQAKKVPKDVKKLYREGIRTGKAIDRAGGLKRYEKLKGFRAERTRALEQVLGLLESSRKPQAPSSWLRTPSIGETADRVRTKSPSEKRQAREDRKLARRQVELLLDDRHSRGARTSAARALQQLGYTEGVFKEPKQPALFKYKDKKLPTPASGGTPSGYTGGSAKVAPDARWVRQLRYSGKGSKYVPTGKVGHLKDGKFTERKPSRGLDLKDLVGPKTRKAAVETVTKPGKTLDRVLKVGGVVSGASSGQVLTGGPGATPERAKYALAPAHMLRAFASSGKARRQTLKSIPGLLAGIAPGLLAAAHDPAALPELVKKDLKERYGKGDYKTIKKGMEKYGGIVYGADAAGGAAVVGRGAGLAARAGVAGRRAQRYTTEPRPRLRLANAEDGPGLVREQRLHPNIIVTAAQRKLDKSRSERLKKRLAKDEKKNRLSREIARPETGAGPEVVAHRGAGPLLTRPQARKLWMRQQTKKGRNVIEYEQAIHRALDPYRKDIAKLGKRGRKAGALAYAIEHGLTTDAAAGRAQLARVRERIEATRDGRKPPRGVKDELDNLQYLDENYESVFTPRVVEAAEAARRRAEEYGLGDPSFKEITAILRARGPQARALGQYGRGEVTVAGKPKSYGVRKLEQRHTEESRMAGELVPTSTVAQFREYLRKPGRSGSLSRKEWDKLKADIAEHGIKQPLKLMWNPKTGMAWLGEGNHRLAIAEELGLDHVPVTVVRRAGTDPPKGKGALAGQWPNEGHIPTPVAPSEIGLQTKIVKKSKGWQVVELKADGTPKAKQPKSLGQTFRTKKEATEHQGKLAAIPERKRAESDEEYVARLDREAEAAGLRPGGYFPHELTIMGQLRGADFTAGGNLRAKAGAKQTGYKLSDSGLVDRSPLAFEQGIAANVKRRFQWDEVADAMDELALIRDATLKEANDALIRENLDPSQFVAVNAVKFRDRVDKSDADLTDDDLSKVTMDMDEVAREVDRAQRLDERPNLPDDYTSNRGWAIVPKAAWEPLQPHTAPKSISIAARLIGKGVKTIPSKLILGLNPSWATIQVVNDLTLAALAIGPQRLPGVMLESRNFWRKNPEELERAQPYIGATSFERELTGRGNRTGHLLTSNIGVAANSMLNALRVAPLKVPKVGDRLNRHRNPLDWMFQATHWEADRFRRAVLYDAAKKEAFADMRGATGAAIATLDQLSPAMSAFSKRGDIETKIKELLKSQEKLEQFGTQVDRMMGNFTRFTVAERRILERNIMFYGFVRFSLRYALWTMPTRHPIVSSIMGHLSQLNEQEVRKLLGVRPDEPLLPGLLAKYYFLDGDGKLQEMPLQRMNPALNAITQGTGASQVVGLLPPLYQEALNQITKEDTFFEQDWVVDGDPSLRFKKKQLDRKIGGLYNALVPGSKRFNIALANFATALAPFRTMQELKVGRTPLSSESLPWAPIEMKYTDPDIGADVEKQKRKDLRRPDARVIRDTLVFPLWRETRDKERQRRYLEDLDIRPVPPWQKKLRRAEKFGDKEYLDIWIDARIQQLERRSQRKLDKLLKEAR